MTRLVSWVRCFYEMFFGLKKNHCKKLFRFLRDKKLRDKCTESMRYSGSDNHALSCLTSHGSFDPAPLVLNLVIPGEIDQSRAFELRPRVGV